MDSQSTVLVVEDESTEREALARVLRLEDYQVVTASGCEEAAVYLEEPVDLVISDLRMGKRSGIELLRQWKKFRPQVPVIMVTAYGEVDSAVEAMKLGAEDYLNKPVNPDELLVLVSKSLEARRKDETIEHLQRRLDARLGFDRIIGKSKVMLDVFDQARRAALVDSTVLVTGESGTGKELIAEAIHQNSPRKDGPFVTANMAAVPENLVESELFGHVKGAFTGATVARLGRFEAANNGTVFIDEIGDFALNSQAKLLRVLENRCVTPLGSNEDREVDVRIVAATSRNLEDMVEQGGFREDLYYRLHVVTIPLPPLRERRDDIPRLVRFFLHQLGESTGKDEMAIDSRLMRFFQTYSWPGNVRQLRNCLESMVVLARDRRLTLDDLPATIDEGSEPRPEVEIPAGTTLEQLERTAVQQTLEEYGGNRTHAAQSLGISVRTLQRKLKAWGIDEAESQDEASAEES
jgi:DNA-binding NtrC family response regulator